MIYYINFTYANFYTFINVSQLLAIEVDRSSWLEHVQILVRYRPLSTVFFEETNHSYTSNVVILLKFEINLKSNPKQWPLGEIKPN